MGVAKGNSYPSTINVERLMCEVEFWEVCFLGKVHRLGLCVAEIHASLSDSWSREFLYSR